MDLDQFKQTFIEEAFELLEDMEEKLLKLDYNEVDLDDINAIFRCAHSIKGGAGSFGFDRLVSFTHILEFLLDAYRNEEIAVTEGGIDALLRSVDVLNVLITAAQNDYEAELGFEDELKAELQQLCGTSDVQSVIPANLLPINGKQKEEAAFGLFADEAEPASSDSIILDDNSSDEKLFDIIFIPERELFTSGNEPLFIIRELAKLGDAEVSISTDSLPQLEDLDPIDCYISWNIKLRTFETKDNILEVFEFVEDECKLEINVISEGKPNQDDPDGAFGLFADDLANTSSTIDIKDDPDGAFGLFVDELPEQELTEINNLTSVDAVDLTKSDNVKVSNKPKAEKDTKKQAVPAVSSIRVDINKIDRMVNMVGELVITQAMIMQRLEELPQEYLEKLVSGVSELSRHTRELQEAVMSVRMQPVSSVFSRMPRIVRDLSRKLKKNVKIEMKGEATEIDKTVIESLSDPLTHMIRNSVDHGIEMPDVRVENGKDAEGTILLSADSSGGRIIIEISDNGAGINREKVLAKAIEKGVVAEDANLAPEEIDMLVFAAGFSTADAVTDVSGRGVGMDVVRKNIKDLGGDIEMINVPGQGSTFSISLPLTLAILDGMVIRSGDEKYIIPINNILETMQVKTSEVKNVKSDEEVINVRGEFIPLAHLKDIFNINKSEKDNSDNILIVLVETGRQKIGIVVDDLLGQQQVVIKNLEENSDPVKGISGATILGDGNVSLILDVAQILKMSFENKKLLNTA